ncbi:MAG: hypothetical protein IJ130_12415 [Solobacterium sp.]|nr:hypothetical protein [Erysipelotrichaceae bacterium]MBQ9154607.1 hypothetical protein [Solobacterium sp.]
MPENKAPKYLYNPELCPCPRGEKAGCPRYRDCEPCRKNHHSNPNTPYTACERRAMEEGYQLTSD